MLINRTFAQALARDGSDLLGSILLDRMTDSKVANVDKIYIRDTPVDESNLDTVTGTLVPQQTVQCVKRFQNDEVVYSFFPAIKLVIGQEIGNYLAITIRRSSSYKNVVIELSKDDLLGAGAQLDADSKLRSEVDIATVSHTLISPV